MSAAGPNLDGVRRVVVSGTARLAVVVGTVAAVAWPMFREPWALPVTADPDAFNDLSHIGVLVDAVRRVGEYPLWNPYYGGGMPWAGSVYNPGLSPQSLLFVLAGEVLGVKLWAVLVLLLGATGMYLSLREWFRLSDGAALCGALLYASAPWMPGVLDGGDYDLMGMYALPFALFAFRRWLVGSPIGLVAPLCLLVGLADAAKWWPFIAAACVLWIALAQRGTLPESRRTVGVVVAHWLLVVGTGVLLAAPKLAPLTRLMALDRVPQMAEREWDLCYRSWEKILIYVTRAEGAGNLQIGIGWPALSLAAIGTVTRRSSWAVGALLVGTTLVAMGPHSPLPVVELASRLPLVRAMGSYGMYLSLPMLVCLVVLAANGMESVLSMVRAWPVRSLAYGALACSVAVIVTDRVAARAQAMSSLFGEPPAPSVRQPFRQVAYAPNEGVVSRYRETPWSVAGADQYRNLQRGVGTITWLGNMVFPEHAVAAERIDEHGRVQRSSSFTGEVVAVDMAPGARLGEPVRTYNTVRVRVESQGPSTFVVNTNCVDGWTSSVGRVGCIDGRLSVGLDHAVAGDIVLRYRDSLFIRGCLLASLGLVGWASAGVWMGRRRAA